MRELNALTVQFLCKGEQDHVQTYLFIDVHHDCISTGEKESRQFRGAASGKSNDSYTLEVGNMKQELCNMSGSL